MKCPIDQTDLVMTERHGIEIDYCPTCRGVWLDRGELDKIIERAVPPVATPEPPIMREYREPYREGQAREFREPYRDDDPKVWRDPERQPKRQKRKESLVRSFLEEVFDFD